MLINTLSAFFAYTDLINLLEAGMILLITATIVFMITSEKITIDQSQELKISADNDIYMYLQGCWLGREGLWRAFIPFFIILNGALIYADYRSSVGTYTIASWLTILVILALPTLWWTISIWRCSTHSNRWWATTARFFTIAVFYELILRLLIGYYYPQIWFNCQQLIMEFGDCV